MSQPKRVSSPKTNLVISLIFHPSPSPRPFLLRWARRHARQRLKEITVSIAPKPKKPGTAKPKPAEPKPEPPKPAGTQTDAHGGSAARAQQLRPYSARRSKPHSRLPPHR